MLAEFFVGQPELLKVIVVEKMAEWAVTDPEAAAKEGVQRVNKVLDQYGK